MSPDAPSLARRISSVTTNCLLSAVVLVAGLGLGRQVMRWWADDPRETDADTLPLVDGDGLGDLGRMHVMRFGDRPGALGRQSIVGDQRAAADALRDACRELIARGPLPEIPNGEALADFLPRLEAQEPVETEPGRWRLYQRDDLFPIVIGTQPISPAECGDHTEEVGNEANVNDGRDNVNNGNNADDLPQRVVVWGMAMPMGDDAWTLFTFQSEDSAGLGSSAMSGLPLSKLPLPDGCHRTFSMRAADGGATIAFEGPGQPGEWIAFYNRWFSEYNWSRAANWEPLDVGWHACYEAPAGTVDIHIHPQPDGQCRGFMIVTSKGIRQ